MAGYTERLQRKVASVVDEKSNGYIAMILDSAKRMGDLIDDLLAFSKIGADARPASPEELAAYLVLQQQHWAGIVAATKLSVE